MAKLAETLGYVTTNIGRCMFAEGLNCDIDYQKWCENSLLHELVSLKEKIEAYENLSRSHPERPEGEEEKIHG